MEMVVLRSRFRSAIYDVTGWEYYVVTHPGRNMRRVTRAEAEEIIAENGLVESLVTSDGEVYDSPGRDFLKKFKGWFKAHNVQI